MADEELPTFHDFKIGQRHAGIVDIVDDERLRRDRWVDRDKPRAPHPSIAWWYGTQ